MLIRFLYRHGDDCQMIRFRTLVQRIGEVLRIPARSKASVQHLSKTCGVDLAQNPQWGRNVDSLVFNGELNRSLQHHLL